MTLKEKLDVIKKESGSGASGIVLDLLIDQIALVTLDAARDKVAEGRDNCYVWDCKAEYLAVLTNLRDSLDSTKLCECGKEKCSLQEMGKDCPMMTDHAPIIRCSSKRIDPCHGHPRRDSLAIETCHTEPSVYSQHN